MVQNCCCQLGSSSVAGPTAAALMLMLNTQLQLLPRHLGGRGPRVDAVHYRGVVRLVQLGSQHEAPHVQRQLALAIGLQAAAWEGAPRLINTASAVQELHAATTSSTASAPAHDPHLVPHTPVLPLALQVVKLQLLRH